MVSQAAYCQNFWFTWAQTLQSRLIDFFLRKRTAGDCPKPFRWDWPV